VKLLQKESVNTQTGELTKDFVKVRNVYPDVEFAFVFKEILPKIEGFKNEIGVLICLAIRSVPNTGYCNLTKMMREEISEDLGISMRSFNNQLYRLMAKGVVLKDKGAYFLNVSYIWRGSIKNRQGILAKVATDIIKNYKLEE
jgi:transcription initiation factor IIE alpha subunit